jgi:hypothetical protein
VAARRRWFGWGSLVQQEEAASVGSLVGHSFGADGERQQGSSDLGGARRGNNGAGDGSSVRRCDGFSVEQREKTGGASGGRPGQAEEGGGGGPVSVRAEWGPWPAAARPWRRLAAVGRRGLNGREMGCRQVDPRVTVLGGGENFIQNQNSNGFELYSNSFKF